MTDILHVDPTTLIETAADPGEFVVQCLERGKSWLAEALEHGDLEQLVNIKGYAETLRVATMQKQLGKDAQLSATELVRRAERCIGVGVRQGQAVGDIRTKGETGPQPPYERNGCLVAGSDRGAVDGVSKTSPSEFFNSGKEMVAAYDMTDDVTDDEFEQAIEEARAEENLSRANLTRKLKPHKAKPKPADRSEFHHKTRRIDPSRIIEEAISTLEGLAMALALIEPADYTALDAEKRLEWLEALSQPLAAINRMKKGLQQ